MKRHRILLIGPTPPRFGGIATFVYDLQNWLLSNSEYKPILVDTALRGKTLLSHIVSKIRILFLLPSYLLMKKPDFVHVHSSCFYSFYVSSLFVILSKCFRKKVILHIHSGEIRKFFVKSKNIAKFYIKYVLTKTDRVVVLSPIWKKVILQIAENSNVIALPNAISVNDYHTKSNSDYTNRKERNRVLLTVACVYDYSTFQSKGISTLIKASSIIKKSLFLIVGINPNVIKNCPGGGYSATNIRFIPPSPHSQVKTLYENADVFVLPSYEEGFPISILEAMASGLPIIASRVGGIPDIIRDNENGFLVDPGDFQNLVNRIRFLLENDDARKTFGQRNRNEVKKYDWSVVGKNLEAIYDELLEN